MRGARNNVLAGGLVLVSIIGIVVVVILLADVFSYVGQRQYLVRFSLEDGVAGLERGSKVSVGGRHSGAVKSVAFDRSPAGDVESITVTIGVSREIQLRSDAVGYLVAPLLGSSSIINFPSLGSGEPLADGSIIPGQASPGLLGQLGIGAEQKGQFQNILAKGSSIADRVEVVMAEAQNSIVPDIKTVVADVREKWTRENGWSARVDTILKNVDDTAAKGPEVAEDLRARLDQVERLLASAQQYLDENREDVRTTIANARSLSQKGDAFMDRLNGELVAAAQGFLDQGREAFAKGESALDKLDTLVTLENAGLRRTLANFRIVSDQLRDLSLEIRRSPWRLLYRPSDRELEYEFLYDSARTYAGAISDVRAAADALAALAELPSEQQAERREAILHVVEQLGESMQRSLQAEGEFLKELTRDAPSK